MKGAIQRPLKDIKKFYLLTQELLSSLFFHEELAATKLRLHKMSLSDEHCFILLLLA